MQNQYCTFTRYATMPCEGCERGHKYRKGHGPSKHSNGKKVGTRCCLVTTVSGRRRWLCPECAEEDRLTRELAQVMR